MGTSGFKLYGSWVDVASKGKGLLRFAGIEARPADVEGQFSAVLSVPVKQPDGAVAYQSSLVTVEPAAFEGAPVSLSAYNDGYGMVEIDVPALGGSCIRVYESVVDDGDITPARVSWPSSSSFEMTGCSSSVVQAIGQALALAAQLAAEFDKAADAEVAAAAQRAAEAEL